jgi:hypothetical protein
MNVVWILFELAFWASAAGFLLLALALARIAGGGRWESRFWVGFFALIGLLVAAVVAGEEGWRGGIAVGVPLAVALTALGSTISAMKALQHRATPSFEEVAQRVVELRSGKWFPFRRLPGSDQEHRTTDRRRALAVFLFVSGVIFIVGQPQRIEAWPGNLLSAAVPGLLSMMVYIMAAQSIRRGWTVRSDELLQSPEMRHSLEYWNPGALPAGWSGSSFVGGWKSGRLSISSILILTLGLVQLIVGR